MTIYFDKHEGKVLNLKKKVSGILTRELYALFWDTVYSGEVPKACRPFNRRNQTGRAPRMEFSKISRRIPHSCALRAAITPACNSYFGVNSPRLLR